MFAAVHFRSHAMLEVSLQFSGRTLIRTYVATLRSWAMSHNEVITELEARVLQFRSSPYDKAYKTSMGVGDKDIPKEIKDNKDPTPEQRRNSLYGRIIRDYRDAGVLKNIPMKVVIWRPLEIGAPNWSRMAHTTPWNEPMYVGSSHLASASAALLAGHT